MPPARKEPDEHTVAAGAVANAMQYLKGVDYPASRDDVLATARRNGADESAIEEIKALPDRRFEDPGELIQALGDELRNL